MDRKKFGQALYNLRKDKFKSARSLSLRLGKNPTYINKIENGLNYPRTDNFLEILEELNITLSDFDNEMRNL